MTTKQSTNNRSLLRGTLIFDMLLCMTFGVLFLVQAGRIPGY